MEVKDIEHVLQLAKRPISPSPDESAGAKRGREAVEVHHARAIEAVETWLREIGALPPR